MATGLHALSDFMVDSSSALHIYDREIDSRERTSLSVLTSHIPPGARVLDLGCGSGAIGRYLAQRDGAGTTVIDGLTISADEARLASPHYRRVEVADLDNARLSDLFPAQGYDAIVCADVLEHIRQSPRVLAECRQLLAPEGRLLLSIPNAGYAGLVAELMAGEFRYRQEGLLDETHVRFFTRRTLMRFLREHGWVDVQADVITRQLPDSEFNVAFDALPPAVARHLLALPDALTYQFIVVARPASAEEAVTAAPAAEAAASALPAQALFTAELYLGFNGQFDEARKLTAAGTIGQVRQTLAFTLPEPAPDALKLDPADRPGFLHLHGIVLLGADGKTVWQWSPADAALLLGAPNSGIVAHPPAWPGAPFSLLLHGSDPWIELPIAAAALAQAGGGQLEIDLGWPMSADYLALAGLAQQRIAAAELSLHANQTALDAARHDFDAARQEMLRTIDTLTQQSHGLSEQNDHLRQQNDHLRQQNDHLRQQKQALLSTTLTLTQERDEARQLVHDIENSTVFRATRPIVHAKMRVDRLLGTGSARPTPKEAVVPQPLAPAPHPVDVIVPVYRGLDDTRRCVQSVLAAQCQTPWRLILINDASPEPEVTDWLRAIAPTDERITLLENEHNLGFVGTVNRGMALSGEHDVLLLNSDTEVAGDWLDRIRAAAYGDQRVASVTPFSNNATICSYPRFCHDNDLPEGWDTAGLDALFARTNPGQVVDVPTGVGFCMYIRRAALADVGLFDVENFGKGYGEENDFCIRAAKAGWRNLHLLDTFVRHFGGVSFGDSKSPRERAAMETLRRLHPRYESEVLAFVQADPARLARTMVDIARVQAGSGPLILAVLHDRQGGTERHVQELAATLRQRARFLVLRPLPGQRVSLRLPDAGDSFELVFSLADEYAQLITLLRQQGDVHIHYHHQRGHGEHIARLPARLGVGYDFTAHDYFTICPQISLTQRDSRYCGELGVQQCTDCLAESPAPGGADILGWRRRATPCCAWPRTCPAPRCAWCRTPTSTPPRPCPSLTRRRWPPTARSGSPSSARSAPSRAPTCWKTWPSPPASAARRSNSTSSASATAPSRRSRTPASPCTAATTRKTCPTCCAGCSPTWCGSPPCGPKPTATPSAPACRAAGRWWRPTSAPLPSACRAAAGAGSSPGTRPPPTGSPSSPTSANATSPPANRPPRCSACCPATATCRRPLTRAPGTRPTTCRACPPRRPAPPPPTAPPCPPTCPRPAPARWPPAPAAAPCAGWPACAPCPCSPASPAPSPRAGKRASRAG